MLYRELHLNLGMEKLSIRNTFRSVDSTIAYKWCNENNHANPRTRERLSQSTAVRNSLQEILHPLSVPFIISHSNPHELPDVLQPYSLPRKHNGALTSSSTSSCFAQYPSELNLHYKSVPARNTRMMEWLCWKNN